MARTSQQHTMPKQTVKAVIAVAIVTALIFLLLSVSGVLQWRFLTWWQILFTLILIFVLILALIGFLYKGYTSWSRWTGFGDYANKKTLWDWQQLLIIPALLAAGALWFNAQQSSMSQQLSTQQHMYDLSIAATRYANDQQLALDQQRETTLKDYVDQMSTLLLTHKLSESKPGDEVREVARARTLAALRGLDPERKGILLQFLYEAGLINGNNSIIGLRLADLSKAQLNNANLRGINLSGANLRGAQLRGADLNGANLSRVDLTGATLSMAHLNNALLNGSILTNADLSEANLNNADLSLADLEGAHLTFAILISAELSKVDLYSATLSGADFSNADLFIANLGFAQLDYAVLAQAKLGHADLNNANLQNANFSGDKLT
jgi:uncharacterized protein YjbI with pentapeptide repeats